MAEMTGGEPPEAISLDWSGFTDEQLTGIRETLAKVTGKYGHRVYRSRPLTPDDAAGSVVIEWPASRGDDQPILGCMVNIWDYATARRHVTTVTELTVHARADGLIWAELDMLAGADGNPLMDGPPVLVTGSAGLPGIVLTGRFAFLVSGMKVAGDA
jgi:hypothetical protein